MDPFGWLYTQRTSLALRVKNDPLCHSPIDKYEFHFESEIKLQIKQKQQHLVLRELGHKLTKIEFWVKKKQKPGLFMTSGGHDEENIIIIFVFEAVAVVQS